MKGILIALAATFVVFFGGDIGGGGGHSGNSSGGASVLEVGDQNFTVHQVGQEFNEAVAQISAQAGQRIDTQTAINIGILDQTIARMASQSLFDQAAQDLGVTVSVNTAVETIRSLPQFQDGSGRFSRVLFETYLGQQGQSEADFVNEVRLNLLRNQFVGTIQNAVTTPSTLGDTIHGRRAERRVAEIVTIPVGRVTAVSDPGEAELSEFFNENKEAFTTPEFRSATLAFLDPETLIATIAVPEEDIAEEYQDRRAEFEIPETRSVVQASLVSREDADRTLSLVREGRTLADAAQEVSGLPPVNLGQVRQSEIALPELAETAFAIEPDTVSDPVESTLGWHLVEVSNITPGRTTPLSEARDSIREEIARDRSVDRIFDILNDVEDGLAGGASIEEVARENDLTTSLVESVARNGQTPSSTPIDNPAMTGEVLARLFAMDATGSTEVIEDRSGGFTVVRLDRIDAPRIPELVEIRDLAVEAWKGEQLLIAAEEKAARLADRARTGENLEALAGEFGGEFEQMSPFDRTGEGASLPGAIVGSLFEAQEGELIEQSFGGGSAVARLVRIEPADQNSADREALAGAIANQLANDLVTQLSYALQDNYPVDVDSAALEAAFSAP
jgi:peptidyl-prolyl cis-trans isomerase D